MYFTIEESFATNGSTDLWVLKEVKATNVPEHIESVLSIITNSITNLTVLPDASNKHIYHLIDKQLLRLDDYPLSRVLDAIKFEGDGGSFVRYIGKTVPSLINQITYSMFDASNVATAISIDAVKVSVRDALSNGVDLHGSNQLGYKRLIWTAYSPREVHQTEIHFMGPLIDLEKYKIGNGTNQ